jgi:hypothetical protein
MEEGVAPLEFDISCRRSLLVLRTFHIPCGRSAPFIHCPNLAPPLRRGAGLEASGSPTAILRMTSRSLCQPCPTRICTRHDASAHHDLHCRCTVLFCLVCNADARHRHACACSACCVSQYLKTDKAQLCIYQNVHYTLPTLTAPPLQHRLLFLTGSACPVRTCTLPAPVEPSPPVPMLPTFVCYRFTAIFTAAFTTSSAVGFHWHQRSVPRRLPLPDHLHARWPCRSAWLLPCHPSCTLRSRTR